MSVARNEKPDIHKSEQQIQNWSFDEEFKVLVTELLGYTALEAEPRIVRLAAVESAEHAGVYGLLVLNADGSAVSTGGSSSTPDTDNLLLEDGSALLLENGDQLLLESA